MLVKRLIANRVDGMAAFVPRLMSFCAWQPIEYGFRRSALGGFPESHFPSKRRGHLGTVTGLLVTNCSLG